MGPLTPKRSIPSRTCCAKACLLKVSRSAHRPRPESDLGHHKSYMTWCGLVTPAIVRVMYGQSDQTKSSFEDAILRSRSSITSCSLKKGRSLAILAKDSNVVILRWHEKKPKKRKPSTRKITLTDPQRGKEFDIYMWTLARYLANILASCVTSILAIWLVQRF